MSFVICQPTSEQIALLGAELDGTECETFSIYRDEEPYIDIL